jgi:hypothetical protein
MNEENQFDHFQIGEQAPMGSFFYCESCDCATKCGRKSTQKIHDFAVDLSCICEDYTKTSSDMEKSSNN